MRCLLPVVPRVHLRGGWSRGRERNFHYGDYRESIDHDELYVRNHPVKFSKLHVVYESLDYIVNTTLPV